MTIQVLPEQLASQIAAGEVVERPASVVKELVENAIDAAATTITINIRDGGRQLIQIADNGVGIPADEIETAFLRHATSKLNDVADLNNIQTLGFRGEALAAIAAVSRATIVTRTAKEAAGTRLELEAGRKISRETVGAPRGTVVAVENLFQNVPARLKFLKTITTEKRHIDEFVTRCAMAFPGIRFRLSHNNRITFQTSGNGNLLDVLVTVYGPDTARQLLDVGDNGSASDFSDNEPNRPPQNFVTGWIGPPSLHWSNRNHITLFVNRRWIKDSGLSYAVIQAYHTLLPTGRYPLGVIFLTVPYAEVDVNVHPAKTEVRFRDRNAVFSAVQRAVRQTLVADSPVRSTGAWASRAHVEASSLGWAGTPGVGGFAHRNARHQPGLDLDWQSSTPSSAEHESATDTRADLGGQKLPIMRVVGQVGTAYIVTEGPDGIFLIDQHAAHERILYEQFLTAWTEGSMGSQTLVTATAVHLSPSQVTLLEEHLDLLTRLGFEIEPFGPNAFMVRAIPAMLVKMDPAQGLAAVVEDLERGEAPLQGKIEERIIMRVCKTAAIKAGQTLSMPEMEALIRQLEECRSPHTCPHGRPTLIHLSVAQLAREFGRT